MTSAASLRTLCSASLIAVCVSLSSAPDARALPQSSQDAFDSCTGQSPEAHESCCQDAYSQCSDQCARDNPSSSGTGALISCRGSCLAAFDTCANGQALKTTVAWAGISSGNLVVVQTQGARAMPPSGFTLMPSSSGALMTELRSTTDPAVCTALAVSCQCPAGAELMGQECRALLSAGSATCMMCPRGAPDRSCVACPTCRPQVLSAQTCSAPTSRTALTIR